MDPVATKDHSQARAWPAVWIVAITAAIVFAPAPYQLVGLIAVVLVAFYEFTNLARVILGSPADTDLTRVALTIQTGLLACFVPVMVAVGIQVGWQLQFLLIASIYVSDVCALYGGRKFGRHKLAPRISPGKSVEGVVCGLVGASLALFVLWPIFDFTPSFNQLWLATLSWTLFGVVGDLNESWLKRQAKVKDSGTILRGHGGVLDRIDSLLSATLVAALWVWVWMA